MTSMIPMNISKSAHRKKPLCLSSIESMPDNAIGVYGFWNRRNGRCIYIGKTEKQSIRKRVTQEWECSHNKELKSWITHFSNLLDICYLSVPYDKVNKVDGLETRLIHKWNPEANYRKKRR